MPYTPVRKSSPTTARNATACDSVATQSAAPFRYLLSSDLLDIVKFTLVRSDRPVVLQLRLSMSICDADLPMYFADGSVQGRLVQAVTPRAYQQQYFRKPARLASELIALFYGAHVVSPGPSSALTVAKGWPFAVLAHDARHTN